jgi:hypothetical protein
MSRTLVVFYKDRKGNVPALEWMDALPAKVQDKCVVRSSGSANLGMHSGTGRPAQNGSTNVGEGMN